MATFRVRMTAYDQPRVREVTVPDDELAGESKHDLEKIFYYGQNDFQPQPIYSVSVADVVEYNGRLFLCQPMGFSEITTQQYEEFASLDRGHRRLSPLIE